MVGYYQCLLTCVKLWQVISVPVNSVKLWWVIPVPIQYVVVGGNTQDQQKKNNEDRKKPKKIKKHPRKSRKLSEPKLLTVLLHSSRDSRRKVDS